jgi:hypothetical protein
MAWYGECPNCGLGSGWHPRHHLRPFANMITPTAIAAEMIKPAWSTSITPSNHLSNISHSHRGAKLPARPPAR